MYQLRKITTYDMQSILDEDNEPLQIMSVFQSWNTVENLSQVRGNESSSIFPLGFH